MKYFLNTEGDSPISGLTSPSEKAAADVSSSSSIGTSSSSNECLRTLTVFWMVVTSVAGSRVLLAWRRSRREASASPCGFAVPSTRALTRAASERSSSSQAMPGSREARSSAAEGPGGGGPAGALGIWRRKRFRQRLTAHSSSPTPTSTATERPRAAHCWTSGTRRLATASTSAWSVLRVGATT